jgi:tryptophan synthase alpha chain
VTGHETEWGEAFEKYLEKIRQYTDLPLAVGFGVRSSDDLNAITGKAEVAAFCSKYIEWQRHDGSDVAAQKMKTMLGEMTP